MTLFTPEVIDIIIAVLKAVVILLAVVVCGALLSWVEGMPLAVWIRTGAGGPPSLNFCTTIVVCPGSARPLACAWSPSA